MQYVTLLVDGEEGTSRTLRPGKMGEFPIRTRSYLTPEKPKRIAEILTAVSENVAVERGSGPTVQHLFTLATPNGIKFKDADIRVYEGADHAFANPSGNRYNEEAATDAWEKTLAFFENHLKS